jgi:predicted dehydrogenase
MDNIEIEARRLTFSALADLGRSRTVRIVVVGSGWRAEHFFRIARCLRDRFEIAGVVVRRESEVGRLAEQGLEAVTDLGSIDEFAPDFVVVATQADANADLCEELTQRGHAILVETPPGVNDEQLDRMLRLAQEGARIQVAEQYQFQPLIAARLAVIASGRLGAITSAHVSVAHGYHGVAMLRAALGVGVTDVGVTAHEHRSRITAGPGRAGAPTVDAVEPSIQTLAIMRFGDQLGIYDWSEDQYFSWIRTLRFVVRGTRGELDGHEVRFLLPSGEPVQQTLRRSDTGLEGNLEDPGHRGYLLGDEWIYRNRFPTARLTDDEIAIATVLDRMWDYVSGDTAFYSVAEAVHDTRIARAIADSAEHSKPVSLAS